MVHPHAYAVATANHTLACHDRTPTSAELFQDMPVLFLVLLIIASIFTVATLALYIANTVVLYQKFQHPFRRRLTLILMTTFPVYSVTSLLSIYVPLSTTVNDLVANVFFSIALYKFLCLIFNYFGGEHQALKNLENNAVIKLNVPPICCCCFCIPEQKLTRTKFHVLKYIVVQTAIVKPCLCLIAAVLWSDGVYVPGEMKPTSVYFYLEILDILSKMLAMYGLIVLMRICQMRLNTFRLRRKFICLQLIILTSILVGILCGILDQAGVLPCTKPFTSKDSAARLNNYVMILVMLLLSVLARFSYLGEEDRLAEIEEDIEPTEEGLMQDVPMRNGSQCSVGKVTNSISNV